MDVVYSNVFLQMIVVLLVIVILLFAVGLGVIGWVAFWGLNTRQDEGRFPPMVPPTAGAEPEITLDELSEMVAKEHEKKAKTKKGEPPDKPPGVYI